MVDTATFADDESLTNAQIRADDEDILVQPTDDRNRNWYRTINLTKAEQTADDDDDISWEEAMDQHTYLARVCHQRRLVLFSQNPHDLYTLGNPDKTHEDEVTGSKHAIAVALHLTATTGKNYEPLPYTVTAEDIRLLQLIKEEFDSPAEVIKELGLNEE